MSISTSIPAEHAPTPLAVSRAGRILNGSLLGGLLLWNFLACCFPLTDFDFWWHLKTGELIWERGTVPDLDWYTYTNYDRPWIDLHWGFQLLQAALFHSGGASLVVLFKAAMITLALGIAFQATGRGLPAWLKVLAWAAPVVTLSGRAFERPEMLSLVFLALWMWVLQRVHRHPRLLWCLPVMQVVWINFHALFVLGLVAGGCFAADLACRGVVNLWTRRPTPDQADLRLYGYVAITTIVAGFVNPYFDEGFAFPLELYRKFSVPSEQAFYSKNNGEFQRPIDFYFRVADEARLAKHAQVQPGIKLRNRPQSAWQLSYFVAPVFLWLLTAASFVPMLIARLTLARMPAGREQFAGPGVVYRGMMFGLFSLLGWQATRNSNLFALVAATMLCANLADAWHLFDRDGSRRQGRISLAVGGNVLALLLVMQVAVVSGHWNGWMQEGRKFGLGERPHWFGHAAAKFAGHPGFPKHAFVSHNGLAGVYTYHNGPEAKVFFDARLEVCRRETFEIYLELLDRIAYGDRNWQNLPGMRDKEGRLPVMVFDTRSSRGPLEGMLRNAQWRLVFADQAAAVFVEDQLAETLKLPRVSHEPLMYPPE